MVLKAFIVNLLNPLWIVGWENADAPELGNLANQIVGFVEDTDLSSLGVAGLVVVLFSVIRLLGSVESVFNALWHIQISRSLIRELTDYLGVVVTIPLVLFISVPTLTSLQLMQVNNYPVLSQWGFSSLIFVSFGSGFTLMYQIMPNAQIRLRSSMNGGFLGAFLWILVYYAHIKLQVGVVVIMLFMLGFCGAHIYRMGLFLLEFCIDRRLHICGEYSN